MLAWKIKIKKQEDSKNFETLSTILESVDTTVVIGATSNSTTLSMDGIGLIVSPKSAGFACFLMFR